MKELGDGEGRIRAKTENLNIGENETRTADFCKCQETNNVGEGEIGVAVQWWKFRDEKIRMRTEKIRIRTVWEQIKADTRETNPILNGVLCKVFCQQWI